MIRPMTPLKMSVFLQPNIYVTITLSELSPLQVSLCCLFRFGVVVVGFLDEGGPVFLYHSLIAGFHIISLKSSLYSSILHLSLLFLFLCRLVAETCAR